jgi:hypothetical protein
MSKILTYTAVTALLSGLAGSVTKTQVPWVTQFSDVPTGTVFCILAAQYGSDLPGLYTLQQDGSWKFAMQLSDMNSALANGSTLTLIINVSTSQTFAAPAVVFCNAQLVTGGVVSTDAGATFVVVNPPSTLSGTYIVSALPSAATAGKGTRAFVTDATSPTFGSTVVGSGAVAVPVYCDGTNWKVG